MGHIESAAIKAAVSAGLAVFIYLRLRMGKSEPARWGLQAPDGVGFALAIVGVYLAWMAGSDLATGWRGPWDFAPWRAAPLLASVLRVLAVCVFGAIAEELVFRGYLYGLLKDRVGVPLTIAVTAVGWAALHVQYDLWIIAIIVVDGLLLGVARWRSGSVYVPIAMHMFYNLYAIW
jgi:membrane protease YdiL (CAAX protease family)